MKYEECNTLPNAYHVYQKNKAGKMQRVGIVNGHTFKDAKGRTKEIWRAHNIHFFGVGGSFPSRGEAAKALSTDKIHHSSDVFDGGSSHDERDELEGVDV